MNVLIKLLIPLGFVAISGCVVAPYGYHHGYYGRAYYGPRPVVVAPAPVVVFRP
jgi:hypothetical protein